MNYFNPQQMPRLPARRREAARLQLEQVVSAPSRQRSKSAVIAAGATAIVLGTGAAAAAIVAFQPVTNKTQARCYTVADAASSHYTTILTAGGPGTRAQVRDALSVCAALFREGFLTVGGPGVAVPDGQATHHVPRLVVCTMRNGTASVFPGGAPTCSRLDLPAASKP